MRVNIYEADGVTLFAVNTTLEEAFPDEPEEREAVMLALKHKGAALVGGGAAPAFYIVKADQQQEKAA